MLLHKINLGFGNFTIDDLTLIKLQYSSVQELIDDYNSVITLAALMGYSISRIEKLQNYSNWLFRQEIDETYHFEFHIEDNEIFDINLAADVYTWGKIDFLTKNLKSPFQMLKAVLLKEESK